MQRADENQFGETLYPVISLAADARGRFGGEPWIYANQIAMAPAKGLNAGQVVRLADPRGRHLGVYHFNPHSLIAARLLSRNPRRVIDRAFFAERLTRALRRRAQLFAEPFYRLAHAEGDGLPGLIVDRYGDVLVLQPNTAGMTASLDVICDALDRLLRPAAILVSASGPARLQEGLADQHACIAGTAPDTVWARENGLAFRIDPLAGQKTGWFYDHRENRAFASRLAHGQRVLDLYTYAGGFALTAAAAGAAAVTALDRSAAALALARQSAERNGLAVDTVEAEAFGWLEANETLLRRTVAFYLCSPANPQGAMADRAYISRALALARQYDFMLFADECYSEIYTREPPLGALEVAAATPERFRNLIVFNSLSKRSNLPGMRSGFCAGDGDFMETLAEIRNIIAPQMPGPVQHASAACWSEEQHVTVIRQAYRLKFDICDEVLGNRFGYQRPPGGFFLWLDVKAIGGSVEGTVTLWKRCGVRVLPGAYLAQPGPTGANPGETYVRVALVHGPDVIREALERIVSVIA